jgi:hypothetical protein
MVPHVSEPQPLLMLPHVKPCAPQLVVGTQASIERASGGRASIAGASIAGASIAGPSIPAGASTPGPASVENSIAPV